VAPLALAGLAAATVLIVKHAPSIVGSHSNSTKPAHTRVRKIPPYWTVHPGDTLTMIAHKTGVSVDQLEARNPRIDPQALVPGERLLLWRHRPKPRPKPLGPRFWTVKPGESFGSIAARTGINITKIEELNPRLKPTTLQPGDRVRLRK
jgi:LysM repeat protein